MLCIVSEANKQTVAVHDVPCNGCHEAISDFPQQYILMTLYEERQLYFRHGWYSSV